MVFGLLTQELVTTSYAIPKFSLHHIATKSTISFRMPNENIALATHIETIQLTKTLMLKNVLFVPAFQFNLIFVSKFCFDNSCLLKFLSTTCEFYDPSTGKRIGLGKVINGLYYWTPEACSIVFLDFIVCITNNKDSHCNTNINKKSFYYPSKTRSQCIVGSQK